MKSYKINDTVQVPRPVVTVRLDAPVREAERLLREKAIHHLVVLDPDTGHPWGVVADRDLAAGGTVVGDVARRVPPLTERSDLREALAVMRSHGASAVPVVRNGHLAGIVTETDLLRTLERALGGGRETVDPLTRAETAMANPLMANLMQLLGEAGI